MIMTRRPKQESEELHQRILDYCQEQNLPLDRDELDGVLRRAEQEQVSHLELIYCLLSFPAQRRRERSTELRIQKAKFRDPVTLEAFDWKFNAYTSLGAE